MPRGNDKEAALHELADQFGEGVGNAEELISANAERRTAELAAISDLPILEDATKELDLDKLEGPNGEYVVDAAVRGSGRTKGTIVVYETEDGRLLKHLSESNYEERGQDGPRRSSHAKPDDDAKDQDGKAKAAAAGAK